MDWTWGLYLVCFGVFFFLMFGLESSIKTVMDGKVKMAEANARAEEARLERARLEKSNL